MINNKEKIEELVYQFLLAIGEDPQREGLLDTPKRVAAMCDELLNPSTDKALYTTFDSEQYGGIVLVRDIDFSSMCEHHIMPFVGKIHIAYIPQERVIGISKLARIVDKHSKKLQIQERLAHDIANDLSSATHSEGVAIYIEAEHLCMNIRGVQRRDAVTITTHYTGCFQNIDMQNMFLNIISMRNK